MSIVDKAAVTHAEPQPQVGDVAPEFSLPNAKGETVSLSDFKGKNVVLYFYPKDDTPGCTTEGKDFRDLKQEFDHANTVIIGVSKCSTKKHDTFACKYDFNFDLLSDEYGDVCERYGVWIEKSMYGKKYMGIQRATFLINGEGKIAQSWPKVSVKDHARHVLEAAKIIL